MGKENTTKERTILLNIKLFQGPNNRSLGAEQALRKEITQSKFYGEKGRYYQGSFAMINHVEKKK